MARGLWQELKGPCMHAVQHAPTRGSCVCLLVCLRCMGLQVGPWRAAYHDDVETLANFGAANKEGIAELVRLWRRPAGLRACLRDVM